MPTRPLSPCIQSGCPRPAVSRGRCAEHAALLPQPDRASNTERGYGSHWRVIRDRYISLHPYCAVCGAPSRIAHHLVELKDGGTADESNLVALCAAHHNELHHSKQG